MTNVFERAPIVHRNPDGTVIQLPGGSAVGEGTWIDPSVVIEGPVNINASIDSKPSDPTIIEAGVVLERSVHIGMGVLVSANCRLGQGTQIEGHAMLGENVTTGAGVGIAEDALIEKDVIMEQGSIVIRGEILNPGQNVHKPNP